MIATGPAGPPAGSKKGAQKTCHEPAQASGGRAAHGTALFNDNG